MNLEAIGNENTHTRTHIFVYRSNNIDNATVTEAEPDQENQQPRLFTMSNEIRIHKYKLRK